jgi:hypothetical protein
MSHSLDYRSGQHPYISYRSALTLLASCKSARSIVGARRMLADMKVGAPGFSRGAHTLEGVI